ncbi:MAG: four helix bundle protein [Planctomycetes bacterium]|nr:four helix bundle protein [Planctomycetota bacterium]
MARRERSGFRNLNVWQKAMVAVKEIYQLTRRFPKDELYALTSQTRRAAASVPMNIAEGYKRRRYPKDYVRLLVTAHGSQGEVETAIEIAYMLEYITEADCERLLDVYDELGRMLNGLIDSVDKGANKNNR